MFWGKNNKKKLPLHIPVLLYKCWVHGGVHTLHGHVFLMMREKFESVDVRRQCPFS